MSPLDRLSRTFIGICCIAFAILEIGSQSFAALVIGTFGLFNLVSAMTSICPAYTLFGVSSEGSSILLSVASQRMSRNLVVLSILVLSVLTYVLSDYINDRVDHSTAANWSRTLNFATSDGASPMTLPSEERLARFQSLSDRPLWVAVWKDADSFRKGGAPLESLASARATTPPAEVLAAATQAPASFGVFEQAQANHAWARNELGDRFVILVVGKVSFLDGLLPQRVPWTMIVLLLGVVWLSVWAGVYLDRFLRNQIDQQNRLIVEQERSRQKAAIQVELMERELADLREFDAWKTHFSMIASHELRTPVATIQAACDLLLRYSQKLSSEQRDSRVKKIQGQLDRLSVLLDDLLFFGRSGISNPDSSRIWTDVSKLVSDVCADLDSELIEFQAGPEPVHFHVDPVLFRRAAARLLSAAHSNSDGRKIEAVVAKDGETLIVQMRDSAIQSNWRAVADALNAGTRQSGTSKSALTIGLAIALAVVELHEGAISLTTSESEGTVYQMELPMLETGIIGDQGADAEEEM